MTRGDHEPFTLYGLLAKSVETDDDPLIRDVHARSRAPASRTALRSPRRTWRSPGICWRPRGVRTTANPTPRSSRSRSRTTTRSASTSPAQRIASCLSSSRHGGITQARHQPRYLREVHPGAADRLWPVRDRRGAAGSKRHAPAQRRMVGQEPAFNRGLYNFDEVRYDYYRDANASSRRSRPASTMSGRRPTRPLGDPVRFPALREGRVIKESIPNSVPKGMNFVFNTRRPVFKDRRVREALAVLFDFEWANRNLLRPLRRTCSFFEGSELSSCGRPADVGSAHSSPRSPVRSPPICSRGGGSRPFRRLGPRPRGAPRSRPLEGGRVRGGRRELSEQASGVPFAFEILAVNGIRSGSRSCTPSRQAPRDQRRRGGR